MSLINFSNHLNPAMCIHELFELQAQRTPNAIALMSANTALTYQDLNERSNQLAHYLTSLGVGPETLVGLCVERSFEMVIGMLGILKAGGAYVPLDPHYPQKRLSFLIEDAELLVLLTQTSLLDHLPQHHSSHVYLDSCSEAIAQCSTKNPHSGVTEQNLAYMIYTSGSTGAPKGVLLEHRGVCNLAQAQSAAFGVEPSSCVLQFASMSFDASVSEIFVTLLNGARLYLDCQSLLSAGPDLIRLLREQEISVVTLPPSVLATLAVERLPALRTLVVAGEACSASLISSWAEGRCVLDAYGPTEITVCATIADCTGQTSERPPIGRAMAGIETYILTPDLQPALAGVTGEIFLGGVGLARGYNHRADLTAQKFVPHVFSDMPGARLYQTGDRGRYLSDGQIDFVGRVDDQVKLNGFRIELGEIEAWLSRHASVEESVVLVREAANGEKDLIAYIVSDHDQTPVDSELRSHLSEHLPRHMIPARFVTLDKMPLLPNGKIDRQALLRCVPLKTATQPGLTAPHSTLESRLVRLWCDVLGLEDLDHHDNFFGLGADSLKAAMFLNRLQEDLGEVVYVVALFDAPTVAELAAYLRRHHAQAAARLDGEDWPRGDQAVSHRIDQSNLDYIRSLIKPPAPLVNELKLKNPSAILILSPPRSGSTLLRVMLAAHPALFAPPELQLLSFNTLQEREATFTGRYSFWREGTIRALMNIMDCDAKDAGKLMADCEAKGMTTPEFYLFMQERIGSRKLVDKTPAYALNIETLRRAENYFTDAQYIHLSRHPNGMIRSFEDAKLEQIFRYEHSFSARQLGELVWTICHQNISDFLQDIPPQRQYRIKFEELVKQPAGILKGLCEFLELEFHPPMAQLGKDKDKLMTDGIHGLSRMLGDIKFHTHKEVDSNIADRWKNDQAEDFLSYITWQTANSLGYEKHILSNSPLSAPKTAPLHSGQPALKPQPRNRTTW